MQEIDTSVLKQRSKEVLQSNRKLCFIGLGLIPFILNFLSNITDFIPALKNSFTSILFVFIMSVILLTFTPGFARLALNLINYKYASLDDILHGFKVFGKTVAMGLFVGLVVTVGTLFFIVPGVIIGISLYYSFYILAEDTSKPISQCLSESREMMNGYKLQFFLLELSFIGWYILEVLSFGIAALWVSPYTTLTEAQFYEELKPVNLDILN